MLCGYHFTGPISFRLSAPLSRGRDKSWDPSPGGAKSVGHYNVITSYSADPKDPEIEYCPPGHERSIGGTVIERERDMLTDRK